MKLVIIICASHWRIQGAPPARALLRVEILSFRHTNFSRRSRLGSRSPPYEVGVPPTGNPGSATASYVQLSARCTNQKSIPLARLLMAKLLIQSEINVRKDTVSLFVCIQERNQYESLCGLYQQFILSCFCPFHGL